MRKVLALIPSLLMLLLATALLFTATYAWLAMNTNTTVSNVVVQAENDGGIVISVKGAGNWGDVASATSPTVTLMPTSTKDTTNWYFAKSTLQDNAQGSQAASKYKRLTISEGLLTTDDGSGKYKLGFTDDDTSGTADKADSTEKKYYLLHEFTIRAASKNLTSTCLYINSVTASVSGDSNTPNFNKSLRIAIKIDGDDNTYIYAPISGATTTYKVGGGDTSSINIRTFNDKNVATTIDSISTTGFDVKVYAYFEGEDVNCKSSNITGTLDRLQAEIVFGTDENTFAVTQNLTGLTSNFNGNMFVFDGDLSFTLTATSGSLPATINVTIGGTAATAGVDYDYDNASGIVTIFGSEVDGPVVITAVAGS